MFNPTKSNSGDQEKAQPTVGRDGAGANAEGKTMNTHSSGRAGRGKWAGFTLIEMLVVVAIIGILASMLLPVMATARKKARVAQARKEIADIVGAVNQYYSVYGRFPSPPSIFDTYTNITYGTTNAYASISPFTVGYTNNNSEVVAILMANGNTYLNPTNNTILNPNAGGALNPQRTLFLNARISNESSAGNPMPGVGKDGIYRDPWGNPYIISMDLTYANTCYDTFYRLKTVSQLLGQTGYNGEFNSVTASGNSDFFYAPVNVMVWSAGPDGTISSGVGALVDPNKDNILSWSN